MPVEADDDAAVQDDTAMRDDAGSGRRDGAPRRIIWAGAAVVAGVAGVAVLALAVGLLDRGTTPGSLAERASLTAGPVLSVPDLPECGEPLPDLAPDPRWTMAADVPGSVAEDLPGLSGDVLLGPGEGGRARASVVRSTLLLLEHGVVVSVTELGASGEERTGTRDIPIRVLVSGAFWRCADEAPMTAGTTYSLVPALEITDAGVPAPATTWLLGVEHDLTVTGPRWSEVDRAALPDLPFRGRLLRAVAHADGGAWDVTTEPDDDRRTREVLLTSLEDAGYTLVTEETDPTRPFWWAARFDGPYDVVVDVSNETGGGFYVSWAIRER